MNFKIFTLFPELFPGCLDFSVTGNALQKKLWNYEAINIRNYAQNKHKTVDDIIYGGGDGMLLKPDVLATALEANLDFLKKKNLKKKLIYLSPRGKLFNQEIAQEYAKLDELAIICGRYEGIDQRVLDEFLIEEISIGDYILSGGEIATFVIMDSVIRNIDNVLGGENSRHEESFGSVENQQFKNLLEYDQYTRPAKWRNREVPEVLMSGNHKKINEWRIQNAKEVTKKNRPDLYNKE